jgi:hypothetical protein
VYPSECVGVGTYLGACSAANLTSCSSVCTLTSCYCPAGCDYSIITNGQSCSYLPGTRLGSCTQVCNSPGDNKCYCPAGCDYQSVAKYQTCTKPSLNDPNVCGPQWGAGYNATTKTCEAWIKSATQ